MKLGVIT